MRVFAYNSGTDEWGLVGQEDMIGEAGSDNLGIRVSLSGDGMVLAASAPNNDSNKGHVRVYLAESAPVVSGYDFAYDNLPLSIEAKMPLWGTIVDGIGNAYSDEILHRARLSPFKLTQSLTDDEIGRLHQAVVTVLTEWTERFRAEVGEGFPEKVTAFRPEMAVHGRYREPCPACGAPVQRIVYAENETNYCAPCQTGGKLLADRALSRLLKKDWPRSRCAAALILSTKSVP